MSDEDDYRKADVAAFFIDGPISLTLEDIDGVLSFVESSGLYSQTPDDLTEYFSSAPQALTAADFRVVAQKILASGPRQVCACCRVHIF